MSIRSFLRLAAHAQMLPVLESGEETLVGGQAVMEGVMMRAPHSYCVAVRRANGEIATEQGPIGKVSEKYRIFKYPLLRGVGVLGQAMYLGMKALRFSANAAMEDIEPKRKGREMSGWVMGLNLAFSLGFFIFLYKLVPLWLATRLSEAAPALHGRVAFNLTDGVIRLGIFLLFLWGVSRWKEIRRVFQYHGAEHKVVFNFESGQPVTVGNAREFPTWHPRCGTSFLLVVMMTAIIVYTLVPFQSFAGMFASRIVLLPLIAGVSYEVIRYAARRRASVLAALTAPGLWLQRITTQPPTDDQTAVAIRALDGAMAIEEVQGGQLTIA
ncbi:MAG: DUF1385 domain-containing protein [Bryobacteraceae bacterium]|nr:DUF1385 domain-containing protein [Bryobacteraceae bacterium]